MTKSIATVLVTTRGTSIVIKTAKPRRTNVVKMFKSSKFRWTACGLCPVWLVPETQEEVIS